MFVDGAGGKGAGRTQPARQGHSSTSKRSCLNLASAGSSTSQSCVSQCEKERTTTHEAKNANQHKLISSCVIFRYIKTLIFG